jgi:hypothetical protein
VLCSIEFDALDCDAFDAGLILTFGLLCFLSQEEPPDVKAIIDDYIGSEAEILPLHETGKAVEGFRWKDGMERSSIFAWTRLLDRLDEYLSYVTESNIKKLLDPEASLVEELPVPAQEVVAALDCSTEILRHVAGKEHYNSLTQLCDLLASSSPVIVNKVLLLLRAIYERNVSGDQSVPVDLANRLQAIAAPQCGPLFLDIARQKISKASNRDAACLKFTIEANPSEHVDERTEEEKKFGSTKPNLIKYASRSELPSDDFEALRAIIDSHGPVHGRRQRFRLLRCIRACGVYGLSESELELEACNRLLAAAVLVPVSVLGEVYGRVQETFRKLGAEELIQEIFMEDSKISDNIVLYALQALTARISGSERSSYKHDGLERLLQDGKYSPLGQFLELRCSQSKLGTSIRVRILEETLSMVHSLCGMSFFCEEILELDIIEKVLPFIGNRDAALRGICEKSVSVIEILFTITTSGSERLSSCNGLDVIQERLRWEVSDACLSGITYDRRLLVKKLMKALTRVIMTSDTSGIDEKKVETLYWAIMQVFKSFEVFGCGVFDAATSCFRQVLHYDPLQYKAMSALGLDVSYLDAVAAMKGRDSSISANIIPTLSAICLSEAGRDLVKSKSAVHLIADTFTDLRALCSLPPSHVIGRSLEEMIRHHETMLDDVVGMMVSAVDIVRKLAHTGEIVIDIDGNFVKDFPHYISIAITRLTEVLIPVCEANKAAAQAFLEQGGLQMFIDLAQPKLSVDCFSCTQAGHAVVAFLRSIILLEEQREYAIEIMMAHLRASLDVVNNVMLKLESKRGLQEFCSSGWQEKSLKGIFEQLIRAVSKSTILMSGFAFRRAGGAEHKSHALVIDANLCVLPELEKSISKVIWLLTVSDEWRLAMDMELKDTKIDHLEEVEKEVELKRDALNLYFRAVCTFYNNIGRFGESAKLVWSEQNGFTALDCLEAQQVIGLLSASSAIRVLLDLSLLSKGDTVLARHAIRSCRLLTAILFDQRKKCLFSCSLNAFIEFGGLDLLLDVTSTISEKCLEVCWADGNSFVPTVKEIKEQERSVEITGIGRSRLRKDLDASEWGRRSVIISSQHAFLSMLGILEIMTSRNAYKREGAINLRPGLFEPPYWVHSGADSLQKDLIVSICRRCGGSLQSIKLGMPWSNCPLVLTKFLRCLSNCQKEGAKYLTEFASMDLSKVLDIQVAQACRRDIFAGDPNEETEINDLMSRFPGFCPSIVLDAYLRFHSAERLKTRQRNVDASIHEGKSRNTIYVWDATAEKDVEVTLSSFSVVPPLKRNAPNTKAAKQMVRHAMAMAHMLLHGDGILRLQLSYDPLVDFSKSSLTDSFDDLIALVGSNPLNVHDIADALVECHGKEISECSSALSSKFESHLLSSTDRITSMSSVDLEKWAIEGKDNVLGPVVHLLAAVLNVSVVYRRNFAVSVCRNLLKLLHCWKKACIGVKKAKGGNLLRVPKWVDSCLLCLSLVCEELFHPDKDSLVDGGPLPNVEPLEKFISKVEALLPARGNPELVEFFVAASSHAIDCLKMSLKYAEHGWTDTKREDADSPASATEPCPRSSVSASLELLAATSKLRQAANMIINNRGHNLILSLSEPLNTAESEKMVSEILKHLLEDDDSLQSCMEATIRAGMQRKRRGPDSAVGRSFRTFTVKQFVSSFLNIACRDPVVFAKAVERTCNFSQDGSSVRIDIKVPISDGSSLMEAGNHEEATPIPRSGSKPSKSSPKKVNKKLPSSVATVMDAIIGRLMQASMPSFLHKSTESSRKHSGEAVASADTKSKAELYCLCQQSLCVNLLSSLLASFSHCVTAFLRRDSDPLSEWVLSKHSAKSPAKFLQTPHVKSSGEDNRVSSGCKRAKLKDGKAPHSTSTAKSRPALPDACFLIHSIIRNQISYHGSNCSTSMRQALSKDACSLLITLLQRSKEGQARVCRELGCVLRSFAYYPTLNVSSADGDPLLQGQSIRSLETKDTRPISADLEGSLVLLATMLSVRAPGQSVTHGNSFQKQIIESLLTTGSVEVLVDILACIDLSDVANERTKVCLSAIIRSLERLTSIRATDKPENSIEEEHDADNNFEELIAHLNERGWHLAGDEPESDDAMGMETHSSSSALSENPSYLSDTSYSSLSGHSSFGMDIEDSGGHSESTGESGDYSTDLSLSGSLGESDVDEDTDEDMVEENDIDDDVREFEFDFEQELDDIWPPEEVDFDAANLASHPVHHSWNFREFNDFQRARRDLVFDGSGDSDDDEDGYLNGNDAGVAYYSEEEYDEEGNSLSFDDDRLIPGHAQANAIVPAFWMQDDNGERGSSWRDADPLFGTAFISPRLLTTRIGLFRHRDVEHRTMPASSRSHPLITRHNMGMDTNADSDHRMNLGTSTSPARWHPSQNLLSSSFRGIAGPLSDHSHFPEGTQGAGEGRLPQYAIEQFASVLDESMNNSRSEPDGPTRRRDRQDLGTNINAMASGWDLGVVDRSRSPIYRPRQRQRTGNREHGTGIDVTVVPSSRNPVADGGDQAAEGHGNIEEEGEDELEPIDPEFLAALPPELQREVLESREIEMQERRLARESETLLADFMSNDVAQDTPLEWAEEDHSREVEQNDGNPVEGQDRGNSSDRRVGQRFGDFAPRPQIVSRPISVVADLDRVLREEGILAGERSLLSDLEELRDDVDDGAGVGSRLARLFESRQLAGLNRRSQFGHHSRTREARGTRDMSSVTANPFRDNNDRQADTQSDRKPLLQENQIPHLIKLLKFSRWEGRLHLNRVMRHLTESKVTSNQVFEQIFALLRCPLSKVESDSAELRGTLEQLKHPMPSLLTKMHDYVVATHGSSTVVHALGLQSGDEEGSEDNENLATPVVRRLLELLRHCFNLVKRGVDVILSLDEVRPLYCIYRRLEIIKSGPAPLGSSESRIPALDVLLSLPLRHGISKGNLRSASLELVCKFLIHFEKNEIEIRDKEQKIREKKMHLKRSSNDVQYPSISRLEIEKLEKERDDLVEKASPVRERFREVNSDIVRNYVMMLTYPSMKESETDFVRTILQLLTTMNTEHWETLTSAAGECVRTLSLDAQIDLISLADTNVSGMIMKQDTRGTGIFRCLQVVAEGVFQLVVDRFDPSDPGLPEDAQKAREMAAEALTKMLELTKDTLWAPFNKAAGSIETLLNKEDVSHRTSLPLPVQRIRPYVESYFLLHDTLRCSTCPLDILAREISELTEEEEAWTNKREEIAKAAEEQATTSFTRIQSTDFNSVQRVGEEKSGSQEKQLNLPPCLPSSDSDFIRFAENHRKLVNLIALHDPYVLEESMNMLLKHPKLLDFENKRVHFRKRVQSLARQLSHHSRLTLNIRRPHAFEDSFNQLRVVSNSQLRSPLKVAFTGEEGVDAGGVSREWYQVMSREMFNPAISLFEAVPQGSSTYQPNPNSIVQTDEARGISHLDYFKFVGHVVGKALLDDQVIDAHFTRSFYKHLLGQPLTYKDIEAVDPDFFKNLSWILDNSIDGVLDLTFSEENDFFGQKSVIELCPNGANMKVTDANKRDYVDAVARHRMTSAIEPQIHAFLEGFWNVLPRVSLQLFSDHELELMISGLPDVDVLDLRANCEYHGGYSASSQVILWFWEILIAMDSEQRALLLQFVTGTSKVPVGGFSELQAFSGRQKFQIHKAYGDIDRLPTAHTCFNQLDLPEYNTKEQLKERLLLAIHEGKEGFGFA